MTVGARVVDQNAVAIFVKDTGIGIAAAGNRLLGYRLFDGLCLVLAV